MAEAAAKLTECETRAWNDMKKSQKEAGESGWRQADIGTRGARRMRQATTSGAKSAIPHPPGSRNFLSVYAEAQLRNAVVAVTQENVTEGIKGFYKMRKAYIALNEIIEAESRHLEDTRGRRLQYSLKGGPA